MPDRQTVLASLAALNAKPKQVVEAGDNRGTRSGLTGVAGAPNRVRDRQTIQEQTKQVTTPRPKTPQELEYEKNAEEWFQYEMGRQRKEKAAKEKRDREAAEHKAAADRARWKAEEDAKCLRGMQERRDKQIEENLIRSEIKSIVVANDLNSDELQKVLSLLKAWGTERFPAAWQTAVDQVREK